MAPSSASSPGAGGASGAIAFDGANIWSVNGNGGSILKY